VEFALTWSHLKFATEMALANIVSNQQASPITLAKSTPASPKAVRNSNGFMRIGISPPPALSPPSHPSASSGSGNRDFRHPNSQNAINCTKRTKSKPSTISNVSLVALM
jgi:hypothetical protein